MELVCAILHLISLAGIAWLSHYSQTLKRERDEARLAAWEWESSFKSMKKHYGNDPRFGPPNRSGRQFFLPSDQAKWISAGGYTASGEPIGGMPQGGAQMTPGREAAIRDGRPCPNPRFYEADGTPLRD